MVDEPSCADAVNIMLKTKQTIIVVSDIGAREKTMMIVVSGARCSMLCQQDAL